MWYMWRIQMNEFYSLIRPKPPPMCLLDTVPEEKACDMIENVGIEE